MKINLQAWCVNHFACSSCDQKMTVKTKFYEVIMRYIYIYINNIVNPQTIVTIFIM